MLDPKEEANRIYGKHYQAAMSNSNPKYRSSKIIIEHALIDVQNTIDELQWIRERTDILIINVRIQFYNQVKEHIKQL